MRKEVHTMQEPTIILEDDHYWQIAQYLLTI